jgi:hypothetical protein
MARWKKSCRAARLSSSSQSWAAQRRARGRTQEYAVVESTALFRKRSYLLPEGRQHVVVRDQPLFTWENLRCRKFPEVLGEDDLRREA